MGIIIKIAKTINNQDELLAIAIGRKLVNMGYSVVPYKFIDKDDKSFITVNGLDISYKLSLQAKACKISAFEIFNPYFINRKNNQLYYFGKNIKNIDNIDKFINDNFKEVYSSFNTLIDEYNVIILTGLIDERLLENHSIISVNASFDICDIDLNNIFNNNKQSPKNIEIAVINYPHKASTPDDDVFKYFNNVNVTYINSLSDIKNPDMILLPGSRSSAKDLVWIKEKGIDKIIFEKYQENTLIFGICGGYQILGSKIIDPKQIEHYQDEEGLNLLPIYTIFQNNPKSGENKGILKNIKGELCILNNIEYSGYEIHKGLSYGEIDEVITSNNNVYGTYIHGFFDNSHIANTLLKHLENKKKVKSLTTDITYHEYQNQIIDDLSDKILNIKDIDKIFKQILEELK